MFPYDITYGTIQDHCFRTESYVISSPHVSDFSLSSSNDDDKKAP